MLYFDCSMGAAGDMLAGALMELMPDPAAALGRINAFGIPGVECGAEKTAKCGIAATRFTVKVHGEEEGAGHGHAHGHAHGHGHAHRSLGEALDSVSRLDMEDSVKEHVTAVYREIALAESRAHGKPPAEIHFHEIGSADALADISAVCWMMERLHPDAVAASPVNTGSGTVACAHGEMPVPAPATAFLLEGVPSYSDGAARGELCTPTGAALLRHFAGSFGPQPAMRVSAIGSGAGAKDFARPNIVRAFAGEAAGAAGTGDADGGTVAEIAELSFEVDDMTGEEIAFAASMLYAAGAKDVSTSPVSMKKGRPGVSFRIICAPEGRDAAVRAAFACTSTLGVRETLCRRYEMAREERATAIPGGGTARLKVSRGFGAERAKFAADDLAAIAAARGISLSRARGIAESAVLDGKENTWARTT